MQMARGSREVRRWVLISPSKTAVPNCFGRVHTDVVRRDRLLAEMQRLRGNVYLEDGAIEADQLTDGRHWADIDEGSWHLLVVDQDDQVAGCVRFHAHPEDARFLQLNVSRSALAYSEEWGEKLKAAVHAEFALSRHLDLPCVEVGGWALAPGIRGTSEAVRMALAMYSLSQALGGSVGITTATRRHCSSSILRRIGGRSLEHDGRELPPYADPQFKCEMEILRFYSWAPNPRYAVWIEGIKQELRNVPVVTNSKALVSAGSPTQFKFHVRTCLKFPTGQYAAD